MLIDGGIVCMHWRTLVYWDRSTLTAKEISTMKLEIKSNLQLADMDDVETLLADAIDK